MTPFVICIAQWTSLIADSSSGLIMLSPLVWSSLVGSAPQRRQHERPTSTSEAGVLVFRMKCCRRSVWSSLSPLLFRIPQQPAGCSGIRPVLHLGAASTAVPLRHRSIFSAHSWRGAIFSRRSLRRAVFWKLPCCRGPAWYCPYLRSCCLLALSGRVVVSCLSSW